MSRPLPVSEIYKLLDPVLAILRESAILVSLCLQCLLNADLDVCTLTFDLLLNAVAVSEIFCYDK